MRKITKICTLFLLIFLGLFLLSCKDEKAEFSLEISNEISTQLNVGEKDVDFTKFFKIKDKNGTEIEVNLSMNLTNLINESREVAQALNEFADNLEQIEKKYAKENEVEE